MHKSKLIQQIQTFTNKDKKKFREFITASFHNSNQTVIRLFDLITRFPLDIRPERLEKKVIAKRLFKGVDGNHNAKLRDYTSKLSILVEDFIIWQELEIQKEERKFLLMQAYERRGIAKQFFKVGQTLSGFLDSQNYRDNEYFFLKYRLNKMLTAHVHSAEFGKQVASFESMNLFLDLFIVGAKLQHFLIDQSRAYMKDEQVNNLLKNEISNIANAPQYAHYQIFKIYKNLFELEKLPLEEKVKSYIDLRRLIVENLMIFRKNELDEIILLFMNKGFQLIQLGLDVINMEVFKLHQFIYEKKLLLFDGKMLSGVYLNTVRIGCNLGQLEWVSIFIKESPDSLEESEKKHLQLLATAYLKCSEKKYDATLELLREVEFLNLHYSLTAKFLIIRCYYEEQNDDVLFQFLSTFENFVRRHKQMSKKRKEQLLNFIKFTRKLSDNYYDKKYDKRQLFQLLESYASIFYKSWLKEMIEKQFD